MLHSSIPSSISRTLLCIIVTFSATQLVAVAGPTLLKRTVIIASRSFTSYWKDANTEVDYHSSWVPMIRFEVLGPVEPGSQISVEYTRPDGKPWFTDDLETSAIGADEILKFESEPRNNETREKTAIPTIGSFGFSIVIKNELLGSSSSLMSGRFTVKKLKTDLTTRPNEFEFYIDQDWRLPIAWVWVDLYDHQALKHTIWLRGVKWDWSNLHGYLFHEGKEIASTKKRYSSAGRSEDITTTGSRPGDPAWNQFDFKWYGVLRSNANGDASGDIFYLDQHPGDYELKVLYSGKLIRTMTFTIGPDGKVVDNGIARDNALGGSRTIIPVKIVGDFEGQWDRDAWKKDAMYGNPLVGFTAQ